jgi:hypothetical protein
MIWGLPWAAWLLIGASTLPALVIAIAFYRAHGRRGPTHPPTR